MAICYYFNTDKQTKKDISHLFFVLEPGGTT